MPDETGPEAKASPESEALASSDVNSPKPLRTSLLAGIFSSFKHLQQAHANGSSSLRKSDRVSQGILLLALVSVALAQTLSAQQVTVMIFADFLLAVSLCAFLALRFGLLRTFEARQSILIWQLISGSFLLGLFVAFNLKLLIHFVSGVSIGK